MSSWDSKGRVCTVCKLYKVWKEFSAKNAARYKNKSAKIHQIKQPKCKQCAHIETISWREQQSKERLKDLYLQRTYNISLDYYNSLLLIQNNKCLLCQDLFDFTDGLGPMSPVVDHCHDKGHIRGILCNQCNRGLGYFKDNPQALRNAANYLES